jgi:hypothetical protein
MHMQTLDKTTAGPSLNALAAAAIGRVLLQLDVGPDPHDYGLSGSWTTEVEGLTLTRSNVISVEPPEIYSRVTWEISHPAWLLIFTERRQLTGGKFARSAPYQVVVSGDLLEAARFLHVPRELFLHALRADGWSGANVTLEQLRWLDFAPADLRDLRFVMQSL